MAAIDTDFPPTETLPKPDPALTEQLNLIAYIAAAAHGVPCMHAKQNRPADRRSSAARSIAIAIARALLFTDNRILAHHFACADAEEAAAHANRIAEREEIMSSGEFAQTMRNLRAACAAMLGLGENDQYQEIVDRP